MRFESRRMEERGEKRGQSTNGFTLIALIFSQSKFVSAHLRSPVFSRVSLSFTVVSDLEQAIAPMRTYAKVKWFCLQRMDGADLGFVRHGYLDPYFDTSSNDLPFVRGGY